jgi:hypothetical protein
MSDIWRLLRSKNAEIVVNGHDHDYERFAPQDGDGRYDPFGVREFVVGTGGAEQRPLAMRQPNSEVFDGQTYGVIKLSLHARSYDWSFLPIEGQSFRDGGAGDCR